MKFLNKIDGADKVIQDAENRFVTDAEKTAWNGKAEGSHTHATLTAGNGLTGTAYNAGTAQTWSIASHAGTAGSIGTINVGSTTLGVNLGTTSTTAFRGDYGNTAYTHSQAAHAPSNAQANQTLTSGNGMAAWTATSGNLTIAMGTPTTLTTSTTNSLTATSHTHEVTFPVTSVNTKTGAVSLTASDVGAATDTHIHGDISNAGAITSSAITPASTDYILLSDTSDSGAIKRGIAVGTGTTTYLRNNGTWGTPTNTTYAEISEAEITTGTASTLRTITARRLKFVRDNTERYHVGTTPPSNNKLLWIDTN